MTEAVLYHVISCDDNDSTWLPAGSLGRCEKCGSKISREISNERFYLKKKKYDLSITTDGFYIASQRLKDAFDGAGISGLTFHRIPDDDRYSKNYYVVEVCSVLTVDTELTPLEFGDVCDCCGQPAYVVGAVACFLKPLEKIFYGVYRTDLELADGLERAYEIVVGVDTMQSLELSSFAGVQALAVSVSEKNWP